MKNHVRPKRFSSDAGPDDFWLTPPDVYAKLDDEFHFDFDPCPYPRPDGFNSLLIPWGKMNYVNPPFMRCPLGGPTSFITKAISESDIGKKSVILLPVSSTIAKVLTVSKSVRVLGRIQWRNPQGDVRPAHLSYPIAAFVIGE